MEQINGINYLWSHELLQLHGSSEQSEKYVMKMCIFSTNAFLHSMRLPKCLNKQFIQRAFSLFFFFLLVFSLPCNAQQVFTCFCFFTSSYQCEGIPINVLSLDNPKFPLLSFLFYSYLCGSEIYSGVFIFHPNLFTKHQNSSVRWNNAI